MAEYKGIKGFKVQTVSTDPAASIIATGTWSSGGNMNTGRTAGAGSGTQTASIFAGGTPPTTAKTELYNGSAWTETTDMNTARSELSAATVAPSTEALVFAGHTGTYPTQTPSTANEHWNGSAWTELADLNTGRWAGAGAGISYTAALFFGGLVPPNTAATESWNGTSWTEVNDLNTPRYYLAGTGSNTAAIAIGGSPTTDSVEQWNGTSWTATTNFPTASEYIAAAGASYTSCLALGVTPSSTGAKNIFWNGTSWTELADYSIGRINGVGTGTSSSALLSGGNPSPVNNSTEEWTVTATPTTFSKSNLGQVFYNSTSDAFKVTKQSIPAGTWASGGNLNTARRGLGGAGIQTAGLGFAGYSTTVLAITESYNGTSWTEVNDLNTARQILGSAGTVNTASLGFGGDINPPVGTATANTELWNGSSWTEVNNLNTARINLKGFGTSSAAIAAAGEPNSALVENWDGTSWTETTEINTGRQSIGAAGISNTAGIIFGGGGPEGETETWNGSSWTEVNDLNTGRRSLSGSGDSSNALAMGGITTTAQAVVEAWNGSSWTEIADLATGRGDAGSSHGAGNTTALFFGGSNPAIANTEEWTAPTVNSTLTVS
jgi:hypothetical protein